MTAIPVRVLIIEDSEDDATLILRELRRGGYNPIHMRVETRDDMSRALKNQSWDLIISDYSLPRFNGLHALSITRTYGIDAPFIIISGNIGEETAVAAMKAGAHDYLMKDNIKRLVPAVNRELREHQIRTAQKRSQEAIDLLIHHDHLTGLLGRKAFEKKTQDILDNVRNTSDCHALLYLDLDQFKIINDTCGHSAGDELLKLLSIEIQHFIRDQGTFARLGGDEFGLLLENCKPNVAMSFASKLRRTVNQFRFHWKNEIYRTGISVGLVMIDADSPSLQKLLSQADVACFAAKELGRNRIYKYEKDDELISQRRGEMLWASRITKAIRDEQLTLYSQPIVPVNGEPHRHNEILLRMKDSEGNNIMPDQFIPAAERFNLMSDIDRWVIKNSFSILGQGDSQAQPRCFHSINLSGASLGDDNLHDFILHHMHSCGISPQNICFEITETAAISDLSAALYFIKELKKDGFSFALDDFGSGLSSFSYLKNLPVDYLKIDGSFVKGISTDRIDYSMVEAINHIGHVMNLKTIAEFVEDAAILRTLETIGIDYAQGYEIGMPQPMQTLSGKNSLDTGESLPAGSSATSQFSPSTSCIS